jgi:hypothetical protein
VKAQTAESLSPQGPCRADGAGEEGTKELPATKKGSGHLMPICALKGNPK